MTNLFRLAAVTGLALGLWQTPCVQAHTVLLDFGSVSTLLGPGPENDPIKTWNNVTGAVGHSSTASLNQLLSTTGVGTGFGLQMVQRFSDSNRSGSTTFVGLPSNASSDSMFGNRGAYNSLTNIQPEFYLFGLDSTKQYNFGIYASRLQSNDNREGRYTFTGTQEFSVLYDAADNQDRMAFLNGVTPDENGQIRFKMTPGPNNTNSTGYTYLGVLQIQEVPEPQTLFLAFAGSACLLIQRRRSRK